MSMGWTIFLALVAGTGGQSMPPALGHARPAPDRTTRALGPSPSRSLSVARKCWHRSPCPGHWSLAGLEEFDTEEVDETWMVHLDAVASVPACWDGLAWSLPGSPSRSLDAIAPPPGSYFPLRC